MQSSNSMADNPKKLELKSQCSRHPPSPKTEAQKGFSFSPRQSRICPGSCRTDTEINLLLQKLINFYLPCLIQVLIATAAFGSFKVEGSKTKRMEITVKASRMHFFPLKGGK